MDIRRSAAVTTAVAVLGLTGSAVLAQPASIVWTFSGSVSGASFSVPVVTVLHMRGRQILTDDDYHDLPTGNPGG